MPGKGREKMKGLIVLGPALVFILASLSWSKTMRTYYTPPRLAVMQENAQRYEWARLERERIIKEAERWAAYEDERLRDLVPPPSVPRSATIHIQECPLHGQEVLKVASRYGWIMDFDKPYKVICPVGKESYPSNDFYAYLKSGGQNKALLTGEYVDDGWGYKKNPEDKYAYWFVAYYAHWMARRWLLPALRVLSQAYVLTQEPKFAHKCALLLWQLAAYYPDYFYEKQSSYGKEVDPNYKGRLLYHTWETWTVEEAALAYDAIFPALEQDTALQKLTGLDAHGLMQFIEERLLRTMARDIIDGSHRIQGNWGMHQKAALLVALVLDTQAGEPTSPQIIQWVLANPAPAELYTDMSFPDMLFNLIHRDGIPFESPSYNCGWMENIAEIADLLLLNGVNYWGDKRLQSIYTTPIAMLANGQHTTPLGDSNHMFSGGIGVTAPYLERAWAHMRRPEQAKAMIQCGGTTQFSRNLFEPYWGEEIIKQAEIMREDVGVSSSLLPGLGFLTLQTGKPGSRFALSLFYGYYVGHAHFDLLNTDLYAYGWPLTPDLGYPETADSRDPRRYGFLAHTIVHNTCMIDAQRSDWGRGQLVAFHPGRFAQMAEATARAAYPETAQEYRRTVFLIDADPEHAYVVDIFRVAGGQQHDWLVHGTEAEFSSNLPFSPPRTQGTLAGPDVPYGIFYDDEKLKDGQYGHNYYAYKGSAFQWLFNVQEAQQHFSLNEAPYVQWKTNRDPNLFPKEAVRGAVLRTYLLPQEETIFACDGRPQRRPQFPEKLKWIVRRRTGENLYSAFVAVHEMFVGDSYISSVRRLSTQPEEGAIALEVWTGSRRHIIFSSTTLQQEFIVDNTLHIQGRGAALELNAQNAVTRARLFDGTKLSFGATQLRGQGVRQAQIESVNYAQGIVKLNVPCLQVGDEGRWISVISASHEASVQIEKILAPDSFSLAQQDLRTGRGIMLSLDNEGKRVKTNAPLYFAEPGMTIVDETGQPLARVVKATGLYMECDWPLPSSLPDMDKDGEGRFLIMAIGPGDTACIGHTAER